MFKPDGVLQAALDILATCPSCSSDRGYFGGCPACIQTGECIKFNEFLSKSSALKIGRHILTRMKKTDLYKTNEKEYNSTAVATSEVDGQSECNEKQNRERDVTSPRRKKRRRAMRAAKDIENAQRRQTVVGRPSWPLDRSDGPRDQNA